MEETGRYQDGRATAKNLEEVQDQLLGRNGRTYRGFDRDQTRTKLINELLITMDQTGRPESRRVRHSAAAGGAWTSHEQSISLLALRTAEAVEGMGAHSGPRASFGEAAYRSPFHILDVDELERQSRGTALPAVHPRRGGNLNLPKEGGRMQTVAVEPRYVSTAGSRLLEQEEREQILRDKKRL